MTTIVVDTNVAVAANGGSSTHADLLCQQACVGKLVSLVARGTVAIDDAGLILREYAKYLCRSGKPGVGDVFFKHVWNHQYLGDRVRRVSVTQSANEQKGFEELPDNTFDPSDRKFLAVAAVSRSVVLNATDHDWSEHPALLHQLGVHVDQLCPQHVST